MGFPRQGGAYGTAVGEYPPRVLIPLHRIGPTVRVFALRFAAEFPFNSITSCSGRGHPGYCARRG